MSENPADIKTLPDTLEEILEDRRALSTQVFVDGDDIVLNIQYEYRIPLHRIDTSAKLLGWVCHLSEKKWIAPRHLAALIALVADNNEIKIDRSP